MAGRYQDRSYSAGSHGYGGEEYESDRDENDPLAELARLIGQTDPFATSGQTNAHANAPVPPRAAPRQGSHQAYQQDYRQDPQQGYEQDYQQDYQQEYQQDYPAPEPEDAPPPAGPPQWIQRANLRREAPRGAARESMREPPADAGNEGYVSPVHPLHRYAAQPRQPQPDTYYQDEPAYQDESGHDEVELDPSRYDEALYGQIESAARDLQRDPAYPDDPYAYQGGYEDEVEEPARKRGGAMWLVAGILALAVVGTAAAYGYRTYFGARHSGEPPIIKADNSPTKIIPAPSDGSTKVSDRMAIGDGTEKIVPREEQPVDVDARAAGPRVVFPPLNQNTNVPAAASVSASAAPQAGAIGTSVASNGTLPNGEPRKIKTFSVRGDQPDSAAMPVNAPPPAAAKPAPAARAKTPPSQANASANEPLSLAPQSAAPAETRVASTVPTAPAQAAPSPAAASGRYLVQVSSQRNESDAQASFRALQNKFPQVLGSQTPIIKRADLGEKGVYYRAMVGPFGTSEEAAQFCGSLKSAGGQCVVQRN